MVGISGSNPAKDVYVLLFSLFVVCFVSSGLCDELITRPDESYRVCVCVVCGICVCVWCVWCLWCVCVCVCVVCVESDAIYIHTSHWQIPPKLPSLTALRAR